jgi:hypothetical protein
MVRGLLGLGIRAIDWILRRAYRVRPFSDDPKCILRISPGQVGRRLTLSDGTLVGLGDPLVNIHLWNERMGGLGGNTGPAAWGAATLHHFRFSLQQLAALMSDDADWRMAIAVCGEISFVTDLEKARRLFEALGFDILLLDQPGLKIWRGAFWDNLFASWLMWAYNPESLKGKRLANLARVQIWMSRERLMGMYSAGQPGVGPSRLP